MKKGMDAQLRVKKVLSGKEEFDSKTYSCKILWYDAKQECIYLVLERDFLTELSLDCIYECEVADPEEHLVCIGRIRERYNNEFGKILKFEIQNGFYKINLKCVDK